MPLPQPVPGLVIRYSYLWRREAEAGMDEGRKARPAVVVLAVTRTDGRTLVTVAPVTHSPPVSSDRGVALPPRVKEHLGLDDAASWVITDDLNVFEWPGFDLVPLPGHPGDYAYGLLPARLFVRIRDAIAAHVPPATPTTRD